MYTCRASAQARAQLIGWLHRHMRAAISRNSVGQSKNNYAANALGGFDIYGSRARQGECCRGVLSGAKIFYVANQPPLCAASRLNDSL